MKDYDQVVKEIGDALEDSNSHSIAGIPEELWYKIREFIPEEKRLEVANKFKEVFDI